MTDEELDQWRGREAWRLRHEYPEDATEVIAARLAREGRMPPEPVVDPDILAFREWMASRIPSDACKYLSGKYDFGPTSTAFLAGARMAAERERERAKVLVEYLEAAARRFGTPLSARAVLAKYRGEA